MALKQAAQEEFYDKAESSDNMIKKDFDNKELHGKVFDTIETPTDELSQRGSHAKSLQNAAFINKIEALSDKLSKEDGNAMSSDTKTKQVKLTQQDSLAKSVHNKKTNESSEAGFYTAPAAEITFLESHAKSFESKEYANNKAELRVELFQKDVKVKLSDTTESIDNKEGSTKQVDVLTDVEAELCLGHSYANPSENKEFTNNKETLYVELSQIDDKVESSNAIESTDNKQGFSKQLDGNILADIESPKAELTQKDSPAKSFGNKEFTNYNETQYEELSQNDENAMSSGESMSVNNKKGFKKELHNDASATIEDLIAESIQEDSKNIARFKNNETMHAELSSKDVKVDSSNTDHKEGLNKRYDSDAIADIGAPKAESTQKGSRTKSSEIKEFANYEEILYADDKVESSDKSKSVSHQEVFNKVLQDDDWLYKEATTAELDQLDSPKKSCEIKELTNNEASKKYCNVEFSDESKSLYKKMYFDTANYGEVYDFDFDLEEPTAQFKPADNTNMLDTNIYDDLYADLAQKNCTAASSDKTKSMDSMQHIDKELENLEASISELMNVACHKKTFDNVDFKDSKKSNKKDIEIEESQVGKLDIKAKALEKQKLQDKSANIKRPKILLKHEINNNNEDELEELSQKESNLDPKKAHLKQNAQEILKLLEPSPEQKQTISPESSPEGLYAAESECLFTIDDPNLDIMDNVETEKMKNKFKKSLERVIAVLENEEGDYMLKLKQILSEPFEDVLDSSNASQDNKIENLNYEKAIKNIFKISDNNIWSQTYAKETEKYKKQMKPDFEIDYKNMFKNVKQLDAIEKYLELNYRPFNCEMDVECTFCMYELCTLITESRYDPDFCPCTYVRVHDPSSIVRIYPNGRLFGTGLTAENAKMSVIKVFKMLQGMGYLVHMNKFKQNMVHASFCMPFTIDLKKLSELHELKILPAAEQPVCITCHLPQTAMCFVVFSNGYVLVTCASSHNEIRAGMPQIMPNLAACKTGYATAAEKYGDFGDVSYKLYWEQQLAQDSITLKSTKY